MPLQTAIVIGSGPNGLAAAITLAHAGLAVTVYERAPHPGGACTTAELTLPGFRHDVGSSVFPLGIASPFFQSLPLEQHGLTWIHPDAPLAHPLGNVTVTLEHSLRSTAAQLGNHDGPAWQRLMAPLVENWDALIDTVTHSLTRFPHHPLKLSRFSLGAAAPATVLGRILFRDPPARALFAGCAAHSVLPLTHIASSGAGLVLAAAAHTTGWPVVQGGAASLTSALVSYFRSLGGHLVLNADIANLSQIDPADITLFDTSPRALDRIAGPLLSSSFRTRMRHFRHGPGAFKLDWALRKPIPWSNSACLRAATVHLGASLEEITASEHDAFTHTHNPRPFVLLTQPSLFDPTRAPLAADGTQQHTAWAYCHVPNASTTDMTQAIEDQVERYAPGFRNLILARQTSSPAALEQWNPNLVGGDISGGRMTLSQLLSRPTNHLWRTSHPTLYLCSSSTPPGGGVHGMCGYLAARAALKDHSR